MSWKPFLTALIVIPVVDYIWLGLIASNFYMKSLGDLARVEDGAIRPVFWAAGLVYVLLAARIQFFVLPRVSNETLSTAGIAVWGKTFAVGALFGFIVYGVYDLTNHATLVRWPVALVMTDIVWGAFVCGLASLAARRASLR